MILPPVFVREGSFVPTVNNSKNAAGFDLNKCSLGYFPSAKKTTYTWYQDDGLSKSAPGTGKFTLIECEGEKKANEITVSIRPTNSLFVPSPLQFNIAVVETQPRSVLVNGKKRDVISIYGNSPQIPAPANQAFWNEATKSLNMVLNIRQAKVTVIKIIQ